MHHLEVIGLTKRFHPQHPPVLDNVGFTIEPGEILALLGPSGCGKTTTLRTIAGFEQPEAGDILLEGQSVLKLPPEKRQIGIVFQDYALFPHLTVIKNVIFALKRYPKRERRSRAEAILNLVGLRIFQHRMPDQLSGGQQQRVALARAIAAEPKLLLLDEPFSNLDATLRQSTRLEVRNLLKATGMSALLVTHDQEEALSFADRIAVMRAGKIEQIGTPEAVYHQPKTPFVAQFLGQTNIIMGQATGNVATTLLGPVRLHNAYNGPVMLSIRPEHLTLAAPDQRHPIGQIISCEFKGHDLTYQVKVGSEVILVHTEYTSPQRAGEYVRLVPREKAVVLGDRQAVTIEAKEQVQA
jgi:iron(III) transport system ATP-binding protein